MGRHTYSDICKNVCTVFGDYRPEYPDETGEALCALLDGGKAADPDAETNVRGWKGDWDFTDELGKKKRLSAVECTKGDHRVYLINESPYASVGVYCFTVFGPDRAAVEEFVKDFWADEGDPEIEDTDTVSQTI